ncbi:MAG: hypothetical protein NTW32_27620 [Chloroflexi bacterium]|nr:hypothetical protein [Chloroflexota bacterium]
MANILILLDYRNTFLLSIENLQDYTSMDLNKIRALFIQQGNSIEIIKISELDFTRNYKGNYILYQTSEDIGAFYKDYIEDIIYYLETQGAILLPSYNYLLAHNNKNFMELLRNSFQSTDLKTIKSSIFGTAEDAIQQTDKFPVILKSAEGSGSRYVLLAQNKREFENKAKFLSGVFIVNDLPSLLEFIKYKIALLLFNKVKVRYRFYYRHRLYTFYRKKFLVQNFIQGLKGDYKVLYFGGKYFSLFRKNRDNDFRASGSGKLYPVRNEELQGLLNFARKLTQEISFPIIAMDIGFDGEKYHLLEFQCIHIGPYTLQASLYWYEYINGEWVRFTGITNLEDEYCRSINDYIKMLENKNV